MNPPQSYYKVINLVVSNVKRIKAVQVLPVDNVVTIGGANDQGKTSLLDSIQWLFDWASSGCEQPIRHGASKAEIKAELKEYATAPDTVMLGDLVITRKFSATGTPTLKVTHKDGAAVSSPQTILDQLCAKMTFDPLAFTRMKSEQQAEQLRKLVGLDFSEINRNQKAIYDERTQTNRELVQKRAKFADLKHHDDAPAGEVSVATLMQELQGIQKHNKANQDVRGLTAGFNSAIETKQLEVGALNAEIAVLDAKLVGLRRDLESHREALLKAQNESHRHAEKVADLIDNPEDDVNKRIENLDTQNAKYRDMKARSEVAKEVSELEAKSAKQTTEIEAIDADREKQLSEAKFPLPGLRFDDSGVLLNGVPFNQSGTAAKIRASMAIGLALNPRVRVVLIRDASLIDSAGMKVISDMAKEQDAQVWCEVLDTGKNVSVVIEDGQILERP